MKYMVKELADMIGVSVRTLHHYDQIGLLKPESVNPVRYRLYTERDLEKLQQILYFKELDFSLQQINEIISSSSFDRKQALKENKELLIKKKNRIEGIIKSVDKTIHSIEEDMNIDKKEMFKAFDMNEIDKLKAKYVAEVKQKYGTSDAYKESQKKNSQCTKDDFDAILEKGGTIYKKIASLMDREPADLEIQQVIGEFRQYITDSFYTCTLDIFRGLGDMYVNDERFTENIDKYGEGLAKFLNEAMNIYCDNF